MAKHYLGTNNSDGTVMGYDTGEKIGFFGTVASYPTGASQAAVRTTALNTTATETTNTTVHGNIVSDLNAVKTLVNKLRSDLVAVGLIKGSS